MSDAKPLPEPNTLCPLLTAAVIARPKPLEIARVAVIGAQPGVPDRAAEPEAVACQGKQCMLFIIQRDESGNEVAGKCAITMGVIALGHLTAQISQFKADPSKQN